MDLSLNALVEELDDSLFEQASRDFRVASGLAPTLAPVAPLEVLTRSPEVFQFLTELVNSPRTDEGKRARLTLLRRFVARVWVEHPNTPAPLATFNAAGRSWSVAEAVREGPRLSSKEARASLEQALCSHLANDPALPRRAEHVLQRATELTGSMQAFIELVQGRPMAKRLEIAQAVLSTTEDAYIDLLSFALKRLDPQLTRRTASRHDLERAALAPWSFELFRREDLEHAVTRTLSDLGLNPAADGRITIDLEQRPGRTPGSHLFELRVPDQLRLALQVDSGFDTYASWLYVWGRAQHRAHVGRALPFVERRLGDASVVDGFSTVFESLLLEEGWLKRYLRLTSAQAREAARLFAFRQVYELRTAAALALSHQTLCAHGPGRLFEEDAMTRLAQALGVNVPAGRSLFDVDLGGGALARLDAFALHAVLYEHLRERFNEDFFRNPAAGHALADLAARGQRDDAEALATSLGLGQPDATKAAAARVALMGA